VFFVQGGLKEIPVRRLRERHPDRILRAAVHGMLPKNRSRHVREDRLVLLTGETHPHQGQVAKNPFVLAVGDRSHVKPRLPSVTGYYVTLKDLEDEVVMEATPYVPEKVRLAQAEKKRKASLHKQLRAYLLGRGERPGFLPQPPGTAGVADKK
jgi:hypothetical protein